MNLIITSFLLGLAGFDIAGAIIIITALSMKLPKKQIYTFALTSLSSTLIIGLLFSKVLKESIDYFSNIFEYIPDKIYAIIGLVLGLVLLYWFIERVFIKDKYQEKEDKKENFLERFIKNGLFIVGLLFSLWAISDPSFWALVALAAQNNNLIIVILAFIIWMIVGQLPLYVLTIAIVFNKYQKVMDYFNEKIKNNIKIDEIKKLFEIFLSIMIIMASMYFILDSLSYFINGIWLF